MRDLVDKIRERRFEKAMEFHKRQTDEYHHISSALVSKSPQGKILERNLCRVYFTAENRAELKQELKTGGKESEKVNLNLESLEKYCVLKSNSLIKKWQVEEDNAERIKKILYSMTSDVRKQNQLRNNYEAKLIPFMNWLNEQSVEYRRRLILPQYPETVINDVKDLFVD